MHITVRKINGKGRSVFAMKIFLKGEIIEQAPVIPIPADQRDLIKKTVLNHYYFEWGENSDEAAIVLGYGGIYNHSYQPNATYQFRESEEIIEFIALRDILPNEEIVINYNGASDSNDPLWFDDVS